jgi:glycosyltransferase involved in cell wall biosynthesis
MMPGRSVRSILQVNWAERAGGAEHISLELHRAYRALGYRSALAVGNRRGDEADVRLIDAPEAAGAWESAWLALARALSPGVGRIRGAGRAQLLARLLAVPERAARVLRGYEDFHSPGTWKLLDLAAGPPDILHCHNLHGGYFDLRALPSLAARVPVAVTLHDAWMLSGHCAHSFDCERWKTGCGECPALDIYPPLLRDGTAHNWKLKADLYRRSRLHVATPSRWLMDKVERSMMAGAVAHARVIPNGVDLSVFRPGGRAQARAALSLPEDAKIVLFMANPRMPRPWRDMETLDAAISRVERAADGAGVWFVGLSANEPAPGPRERRAGPAPAPAPRASGRVSTVLRPYQADPASLARYYQAADLYVHPAHVDTFPSAVLEALACGTPVVATGVAGIPEQVRPLGAATPPDAGATGALVPPRDPGALAAAILRLLADDALRRRLSENAARDAKARFDKTRMVADYLAWYEDIRALR